MEGTKPAHQFGSDLTTYKGNHNGGLETTLRGVAQANLYLGILQEKILWMDSTPVGCLDYTTVEWHCSTGRTHRS